MPFIRKIVVKCSRCGRYANYVCDDCALAWTMATIDGWEEYEDQKIMKHLCPICVGTRKDYLYRSHLSFPIAISAT